MCVHMCAVYMYTCVYQCICPCIHMWKTSADVDAFLYCSPHFYFLRQGFLLNLKFTLSTTLIIKGVTRIYLFLQCLPSSFRCITTPNYDTGSGDPNLAHHSYPPSVLLPNTCPQSMSLGVYMKKICS